MLFIFLTFFCSKRVFCWPDIVTGLVGFLPLCIEPIL